MTLYVCYFDYGFGCGRSEPKCVFSTEEKAKEWCQKNGIDADYEMFDLDVDSH